MSDREVERLYLLERVETGLITQRHAAAMLGITDRQVRRLLQRYRREGAAGLVSRRRGKPSNRRIAEAVKSKVMERVEARYADFGPTLAAEYLRAEGFMLSKETLRGWMIEAGLWQPKRKRTGLTPTPPTAE